MQQRLQHAAQALLVHMAARELLLVLPLLRRVRGA
jgi:hypothetical protein